MVIVIDSELTEIRHLSLATDVYMPHEQKYYYYNWGKLYGLLLDTDSSCPDNRSVITGKSFSRVTIFAVTRMVDSYRTQLR